MVQKQTLPGDEFTHELTEWEKKLQGASSAIQPTQQRIKDIERKIGSIQMRTSVAIGAGLGATEGAGLFAFRDLPKLEQEFNTLKEQKDVLLRELDRNIFNIDLYGTIPMLIESGAVSTPEDALANISLPQSLTEDEKNNIRADVSRLISTRDKVRAPLPEPQIGAELPPPPELPALTVPRRPERLPLMAVHRLSVDAIIKSLQKPPPVTQFSEAEYNDYLRTYRGWSQEDIDKALQQRSVTILADAQNRKNLIDTFRAEGAKIPDQTFREVLSQAVNQPALSTLELLNLYYEKVSMPFAGAVYGLVVPDISQEYKRFRASNPDAGWQEAYTYAWRQWDAPGPPVLEFIYKYMLMEGAVDPLSYAGVGLFAKGGRALSVFGRVGARMGAGIAAADLAVSEVMDLPFDSIKWLAGKVPKTIVQQGTEASRDSQAYLIAYFERMTNNSRTPYSKLKVQKMEEHLKTIRDHFAAHPREDSDAALAMQKMLIHAPITKQDIGSWIERIRRTGVNTYDIENISSETIIGVNQLFERVMWGELPASAATPELLQRLGATYVQDATEEGSALVARILAERKDRIYKGADNWLVGARNSTQAMIRYARKADEILTKVAEFQNMKEASQSGRFMLFMFNVDNRLIQPWMEKVNRAIIRPFADSYLTFASLGPMNVAEDYIRSVLGGVKPGRMTVERNELITAGLKDDPTIRIGRLSESLGPLPDTGEFQRTQWVTTMALSPFSAPMWAATSALEAAGVKGAGKLKITPKQVGQKSFELMVGNFGDTSQEIRRNFRDGKYLQILADEGGETFQRLYSTVGSVPDELKDAPKWIGRNLKKDLQYAATTGHFHSGSTDIIQQLKSRYTRNRVIATEVDDLIKKNMIDSSATARTLVFQGLREGMMDTPESINEYLGRVLAADREDFLRSPERGAAQFEQLTHILNSLEVTNPSDMANLITSLHRMVATYGATPDNIIAQATIHSRGLPIDKRFQFFEEEFDRLYNYLDKAGAGVDTIITKLSQTTKGFNFINNIDWSRVEFSGIPLDNRAQIRTAIDKLPFSFKSGINRISVDVSRVAAKDKPGITVLALQGGVGGREIVARTLEVMQDEQTLFHELAHSYMRTSIDSGDTEVISEFARAIGKPESYVERVRITGDDFTGHYNTFKDLHEQFSESFSEWVTGIYRPPEQRPAGYQVASLKDNKQLQGFFQTYFPKTQRDLVSELPVSFESMRSTFNELSKVGIPREQLDRVETFLEQYSRLAVEGKSFSDNNVSSLFAMISKDTEKLLDGGFINAQTAATVNKAKGSGDRLDMVIAIESVVNQQHTRGSVLPWALIPIGDVNKWSIAKGFKIETGPGGERSKAYTAFTHLNTAINSVLDDLKAGRLTVPLLSRDRQSAILKYTELSAIAKKATSNAKEEDMVLRRDYFAGATKQNMKDPSFWERFYGIEMSHWNRVAEDMATLNAQLLKSIDDINATAGFKQRPRAPIKVADRPLAPNDVAALMRVRGTELSRMLLDTLIPEGDKRYFVKYVKSLVGPNDEGFTDDAIGAVYDQIAAAMEVDPNSSHMFRARSQQIESMRRDLQELWASKLLPAEQKKAIDEYIESTARTLGDVVSRPEFSSGGTYEQLRQTSLDKANKWFYKEYTDYTHANAIDALFKTLYPFWTYESNRWLWLPRTFIRRPGVLTTWGRWENNTDSGYTHIPGTAIDVNPWRGSVFGPWSTRMMKKDFPEYYDNLEGMKGAVGFFDWVSRYGFYPNVIYGASLSLFGGLETQLGSIMPPSFTTPLNALVAAFPKSETVKFISDRVFSEPFRNYLTNRRVDELGGDGSLLLAKQKSGEKLTEEEAAMWADARGYTALHSAAFEQFGLFRMKSDQAHQLSQMSEKVVQEWFGFTPEQQRIMRQRGDKIWDVVGGLDPWQTAVLKELDFFKYAGSVNAVLPSSQQLILTRIERDWSDVEKYSEQLKDEELLLAQDFLVSSERGRLGPRDFQNRIRDLYRKRREYIDKKVEKNPLMLLKNRTEFYEKTRTPMPVQSPYRELMSMFFEIEVKDTVDPATGERVMDWNKFWANRDMITDAIPQEDKGKWDAYLARHTTPLMQTWRTVYQTYFKKYYGLWDKVKESYNPIEQKLIDEYLFLERTGQQQDRQAAIKEMKSDKDGNQLISSFRSAVSNEREALRYANPQLDAWLYYWGDVKSFKTPQAEKSYRDIAVRTGRKID